MMKLELVISCLTTRDAAQVPEIRAWVDPQAERGLDSEVELKLEPISQGRRHAEIVLAEPQAYLFYRVGIVADPSTVWHLLIRDRRSGCVLHEDSDQLALPKGYLIGNCRLQGAATAAASKSGLRTVSSGQLCGDAPPSRCLAGAVAP